MYQGIMNMTMTENNDINNTTIYNSTRRNRNDYYIPLHRITKNNLTIYIGKFNVVRNMYWRINKILENKE
jgi:hypothetical protein